MSLLDELAPAFDAALDEGLALVGGARPWTVRRARSEGRPSKASAATASPEASPDGPRADPPEPPAASKEAPRSTGPAPEAAPTRAAASAEASGPEAAEADDPSRRKVVVTERAVPLRFAAPGEAPPPPPPPPRRALPASLSTPENAPAAALAPTPAPAAPRALGPQRRHPGVPLKRLSEALVASDGSATAPLLARWFSVPEAAMRRQLDQLVELGQLRRSDDRYEVLDLD